MADKPGKSKKTKAPLVSPRTLALAVVFLGLIGVVAFQWFGTGGGDELIPEPEQVLDAEGKPVPPPQPVIEPEPGTQPPSNLEEVRPS